MRWLLLASTFFMVFITYEAFVFTGILKKIPYSQFIKAVGWPQKSISLQSQNEVKEYFHRQYIFIAMFALTITCFMAKLTFEAFFS